MERVGQSDVDEHVARFSEEGYVIIRALFTPDEMALLRDCVARDERSFNTDGAYILRSISLDLCRRCIVISAVALDLCTLGQDAGWVQVAATAFGCGTKMISRRKTCTLP
jgi:hypothetical protein